MAKARNGRAVEEEEVEEVPPSDEEPVEGDEEEEEYEIEAILDAKIDCFPGNKLGYLVKWKGYSEEHNSWVSQDDAINCNDLIQDYWDKQKKEKTAPSKKGTTVSATTRKSEAPSASTKTSSTAASRKRATPEDEPESISAPAKKRGRPPKQPQPVSESEDDAPVAKTTTKRARPGPMKAATKAKDSDAMDEDEPERSYYNMAHSKYKDLRSWEDMIDHIDTVERTDDGKLIVYFMLNKKHGGKLCREESSLCRQKFPNLLLDFYEHNLRWRPFES